jgi:hypothetical protein
LEECSGAQVAGPEREAALGITQCVLKTLQGADAPAACLVVALRLRQHLTLLLLPPPLLQGSVPPGQSSSLKISFARNRDAQPAAVAAGAGKASSVANDALQAAMAMQQYSGWEPKAFDESVLQADAAAQQKQQQQQQQQQQAGGDGQQPNGQSGFVYDSASGYWYDAATGYYYDANTGLYYHQSTQQWYAYDQATGQYSAVGAGEQSGSAVQPGASASATAGGPQVAAATAPAATAPAATAPAAAPAAGAAAAAAPRKKVAAVIGSKPQLNHEALKEAQAEKVCGLAGAMLRHAAACVPACVPRACLAAGEP